MKNKLYLGSCVGSLVGLIFLINLILFNKIKIHNCSCNNVISYNYFFMFLFLSIVFLVSLFYYLFSLKLTKKEDIIKSNFNLLYSILDNDEKKLFDLIQSKGGKIPQLEISRKFGKIKGYRLIEKLISKKIVTKKRNGINNTILINKNLLYSLNYKK